MLPISSNITTTSHPHTSILGFILCQVTIKIYMQYKYTNPPRPGQQQLSFLKKEKKKTKQTLAGNGLESNSEPSVLKAHEGYCGRVKSSKCYELQLLYKFNCQ